jgi:hypothetical protein
MMEQGMKPLKAAALVAIMLAAAPLPVLACEGKTVVASADNWKPNGVSFVNKGPGEFQATIGTNHYDATAMLESSDNTVGVCADVSLESTGEAADNGIGISFWSASPQNTYGVQITPKGQYAVYHIVDTKWYTLAPLTNSDAIRKGLNQWNEVEMEPGGNGFIVYINGKRITDIIAHAPEGATNVGIFVDATDATVGRIKNLRTVK